MWKVILLATLALLVVAWGNPYTRSVTYIRLVANMVKPACDVDTRGMLWFVVSEPKQRDALEMCMKNHMEQYSWVSVRTAP